MLKGGENMKHYERPVVLASYSVEELVEEAAVCTRYGGGGPPDHAPAHGWRKKNP